MKVGDLVKEKTELLVSGLGIIVRPEVGGWWVHWRCGTWGFHIQTELEVVNASR